MPKVIKVTFLIILVFGIGVGTWFWQQLKPVTATAEPVTITISPGESMTAIASNLEQQRLVRSSQAFRWYVRFERVGGSIQAGEHALDRSLSTAEIVSALTSGDHLSREQSITIVEGWTAAQIGDYLVERGLITKADWERASAAALWRSKYAFIPDDQKTLEGYLFPDTYRIFKTATAEEIVGKMLGNFETKLTPAMKSEIEQKDRSLHDVITLASIIEREARTPAEMKMVSDIFWKRLAINMPLQSDATVNYVTGGSTAQATYKDLETDSPYNTYKYPGLPPGPISNPGQAALDAAVYPTSNEYYYFLTDASGRAHYGRTFEEHGQNRAKYLD